MTEDEWQSIAAKLQYESEFLKAFLARGHEPMLSNGEVDWFAYEGEDYHNGPVCLRCGWGDCYHCIDDEYDKIPDCKEEQKKNAKSKFRYDRECAEAEEAIRSAERRAAAARVTIASPSVSSNVLSAILAENVP